MTEPVKFPHPTGAVLDSARVKAKRNGGAAMSAKHAKYRTPDEVEADILAIEAGYAEQGIETRREYNDEFEVVVVPLSV